MRLLFLTGLQATATLAAADFTIEDKGLATLPQAVEIAIRARTGSEFTRRDRRRLDRAMTSVRPPFGPLGSHR